MPVRRAIRDFICSNFYITEPDTLSDTDSLLDLGIVDSTGVMELIEFLQRQFNVEVADVDMTPANLDSVVRIVAFVAQKQVHAA